MEPAKSVGLFPQPGYKGTTKNVKTKSFTIIFTIFFTFFQNRGWNGLYLRLTTQKIYRYASTQDTRRLAMGPVRQSLSNQSPSGSPSPRNLRIRIPGKARNHKKEIRKSGILTEIPYLCCVFTYRIAQLWF